MADDLIHSLRMGLNSYEHAAADRIEALEAERDDLLNRLSVVAQRALDRDAVIAEARGWANAPVIESDQPPYRAGYWQAQYEVRDILSRVPQGAAEPSDADLGAFDGAEAQFGPTIAAEPWTDPQVPGTGIRAALADLDRRGELPHGNPNGW